MKKIFYLFFVFLLVGCSSPEEPDFDILPEPKMVEVLAQIHAYEALVNAQNLPSDSAKAIYRELEEKAFADHEVDRDHFEKSYAFYLRNIHHMDRIYAQIVDTLNLWEARDYIK
ncbi:MAG: DUF4296 domain-containing protein [Cytophagaceae bacterium]